jgi:hypothetical protein
MSGINVINEVQEDVTVLDDIFIPGTKQTPEITCKKKSGEVVFKGNFIASNPGELIEPIQKWLSSFTKNKKTNALTIAFHLTYLNGSSGKSLCTLFQQAEEIQSYGLNVSVQFFCEDDDVDMLDWCKEMRSNYHLQFSLSKVN